MTEAQVRETAERRADGGGEPPDGPHGSDSLFKNAYFLMLSTGVSAVLGLGFWLVSARYYTEEAVGQGSAAIAAMRLLASITATTMIGAVVRFVPRAGRATGSLVRRAYAASSVVVALAAGVFLLTLDRWGDSYAPLGTPVAGTLFVAACVAWALLTLQDGVLTGLRKAEWVPAGNAVFSVGKLILLAFFASALPVLGIFVSWAVAIAFSTLPLGWLIFRRLIPRQAAADHDLEPPAYREMGRFLAGDSLGALFSLAMINLLPVMVAVRFTAAENGYFYVAYTVGGTMEFMAINMASSLTAHASHDPRRLADGIRGALRRMTLLLVPVVAVLVAFAPQILAPFDDDYAEHGSAVLRLLALGALPRIVVELYIGVLRVQGRTGALAAVQGAMCALVLGIATALFTPAGITGAGWAVLLGMTLVAVGCVPGLRAALRGGGVPGRGPGGGPGDGKKGDGGRKPTAPGAPSYGTRWARLNATAGYGTSWARRAAYAVDAAGGRRGAGREDTVTPLIGRPGHEREALEADPLAVIVRAPDGAGDRDRDRDGDGDGDGRGSGNGGGDGGGDGRGSGNGGGDGDGDGRGSGNGGGGGDGGETGVGEAQESRQVQRHRETEEPLAYPEPRRSQEHRELRGARGAGLAGSGQSDGEGRSVGVGEEARWERRLWTGLWVVLGLATAVFWAALRGLPWLDGVPRTALTGRALLVELPPAALVAGGVVLVVFVASVTLGPRLDRWLPAAALGAAVTALYAVPVALGREPQPLEGQFYTETAGTLAEALGLAGPEPLLRWAPPVLQLLCLVPLWPLLGYAGDRLPWPGRWGVLYVAAVGGWVWRQELAPVAPPLLLLLALLLLFVRALSPHPPDPTYEPPHRSHRLHRFHRSRPNDGSRD